MALENNVHKMKVQFFANRRKIWKCLAWFMIVFCAFACLLLTFSVVVTSYQLIRSNFNEDGAIHVASTVSFVTFVLSFVALICQWKRVRLLVRDVSTEIDAINAEIEKRLLIKCIICLIGVFFFVCLCTANVFQATFPIVTYIYDSNSFNHFCFGCNFTTWNEDLFQAYFFAIMALHGPCQITITCFQVIFYCFLAMALAEITKHTMAQLGPGLKRGSLQNLTTLRRRFHRIRKLVDRLNQLFKNVVLFWLVSTLLTTCRHTTDFITSILEPPKPAADHRNAFFWISHLMYLVLLVSLIWVASRLPEECDNVHNYLPYLNETASSDSKASGELTLFYQELSARKLTLQAGSCFVITKNLLLSFFGLIVTYTVVFIQFTPHLFNKLTETRGNSTK